MSDQKSSAEQEMRRRILERPNDFITLEDGYVYFWVGGEHRGALAAVELRLIAQILDPRRVVEAWECIDSPSIARAICEAWKVVVEATKGEQDAQAR